jgi:hypothetical protein
MAHLLAQPHGIARLGDFLNGHLSDRRWSEFRAAIAFVKYSGVRHIEAGLRSFSGFGDIRMSVGVDCQGSSFEGLSALLGATRDRGTIWVFHNENPSTFHPKVYLFKNRAQADVAVGSGNLTSGGLFTNYEASLALSLDLADARDRSLLESVEQMLDLWIAPAGGAARVLDEALLQELLRSRYVVLEAQQAAEADPDAPNAAQTRRTRPDGLFARVGVQAPPAVPRTATTRAQAPTLPATARRLVQGFVMTLQQTDAGYGQTSRGTTRRSPEVFIPLAARDYSPEFWGWQDLFAEDGSRPGKWDRRGVRVRIGTQVAEVNMMTWPVKHDFRLRSEALRSAGSVGDILRLERVEGAVDYEYYAEIVPQASSEYDYYLGLCTEAVRNSDKRWGYYL